MNLLAQIAQVATENSALYTYGPLGIMCGWLMWRDEKRASQLQKVEERRTTDQATVIHRMDSLTRALLVDMTERESCSFNVKRYAREEIAKIDARLNPKS